MVCKQGVPIDVDIIGFCQANLGFKNRLNKILINDGTATVNCRAHLGFTVSVRLSEAVN